METKKKHAHGIAIKPTTFAAGSKVFAMADYSGVTARTIKERLKKNNVTISTKAAERLHESINGKTKGE